MSSQTVVDIVGQNFHINGQPTYAGITFRGKPVEGLLLNARLVQGIFDDLNPATRSWWDYPDGPWDPERNTREFLAAMPAWRAAGLLAFTINLQGGSPRGYSKEQPWHNSAFSEDGTLREDYLARLRRILDRADELGMVVMLGLFYFGQDQRLRDEAAVIAAVDNATDWLLEQGCRHVMVEIGNEVNLVGGHHYVHSIISEARADELITRVQQRSAGKVDSQAGRLLVSTSLAGGKVVNEAIARTADFLLVHGNGVHKPDGIRAMVEACRAVAGYRGQPIVFNEDDHFDFDKPDNNMLAAIEQHASWGYFDYRMEGEGYEQGYQSVPVDWQTRSARKRGFFKLLSEVTQSRPTVEATST